MNANCVANLVEIPIHRSEMASLRKMRLPRQHRAGQIGLKPSLQDQCHITADYNHLKELKQLPNKVSD
jgi:hypothetical protein